MSESLSQNIKKYTEELAKNPKSRVFVPLADAYRAMGKTEEAIEIARKGVSHYPHYVGGKMALARAYFENGEGENARTLLEGILHTAPDNLLANRILAEIYQQEGQGPKAIPLLKRLLTLEPGDSYVSSMLAEIETMETPTDELPPLEAPIERESVSVEEPLPQAKIQTVTMAEMYLKQGHLEEALGVYKDLLDQDPDNETLKNRAQKIVEDMRTMRKQPEESVRGGDRIDVLRNLLQCVQERRRAL